MFKDSKPWLSPRKHSFLTCRVPGNLRALTTDHLVSWTVTAPIFFILNYTRLVAQIACWRRSPKRKKNCWRRLAINVIKITFLKYPFAATSCLCLWTFLLLCTSRSSLSDVIFFAEESRSPYVWCNLAVRSYDSIRVAYFHVESGYQIASVAEIRCTSCM